MISNNQEQMQMRYQPKKQQRPAVSGEQQIDE